MRQVKKALIVGADCLSYACKETCEYTYEVDDIKAFCFSQYALPLIKNCSKELNIPLHKFIYIGDKYGYTGTSSPFIALYEAVKKGDVKRGDLVDLWTVGTNWTTCHILLKY